MRRSCVIFLLLAVSCSVTRAYPGPARPRWQVSRIEFSSIREIAITEKRVGEATLGRFENLAEVLPGKHPLQLSYERQDVECLSYRDYCLVRTYRGECHGTLRTFAGKTYTVRLSGNANTPFAEVSDEGSGRQSGFVSCRTTGLETAQRRPENHADYDYERNR